MNILNIFFIITGALLMIANIYRYLRFLYTTTDVLSSEDMKDKIWKNTAFLLLIFFFIGYVFIAVFSKPDFMMAMVLFWGSVFVAIVLTLMFTLLQSAKERSIEIAEAIVGVIDARDSNLNGHSRHVQELTMLFYSYLPAGMKREISPISLSYASLMHDVGKLGVPESILNKPAKLDDNEWEVMKKHPDIGVKILKPLQAFDNISSWILYHHERIDGKGYHLLKAEEIPLAARIIAIADTYSAITMRRSYKDARTHEDAVKIISEVAGTQLDPDLVKIFLEIPEEELKKCIPEHLEY